MPVIDAEPGGVGVVPITPGAIPPEGPVRDIDAPTPPPSLQAPKTTAPPAVPSGKRTEVIAAAETAVREAELAWFDGRDANGWVETGGKVYKLSTPTPSNPALVKSYQEELDRETDPIAKAVLQERLDKLMGGEPKLIPDPEGQRIFDNIERQKALLKYATDDGKYLSGSGTGEAVESYLTTEGRKTKEIERQYEDFKDRVDQYNQMRDAEIARGNSAIRMNMDQLESIRDGNLQPGMFQLGGVANMSTALSEILRPSIPDYVRPDYRLNQAVGLPGAEGFDNPNYDQSGFPMFARGTPRARDLSGVDPELRPLIGTPVGFAPDPRKVINKPWPWGGR